MNIDPDNLDRKMAWFSYYDPLYMPFSIKRHGSKVWAHLYDPRVEIVRTDGLLSFPDPTQDDFLYVASLDSTPDSEPMTWEDLQRFYD